jgi:hypothetical protein
VAKKKKKRADHRRGPQRPTIVRRHDARSSDRAEDQPLMRTLTHALYDGHPLALLDLVSTIISSSEPSRDPLQEASEERPTIETLVESFEATDLAATTACLHVIAALTRDELLSARIRRTLGTRQHRLPAWVTRVSEVRVQRVVEMRHVLRDGENYFLDVRLPDGFRMTAVVYVDNNLGQVVKDAYTLDRPLDDVLDLARRESDDDTSIEEVDPGHARARIDSALAIEAITFPPMRSESWPACRPLVRWLVDTLPGGTTLPEPEPPSDKELDAIVERFVHSPYGRGFDDPDHRYLLGVVVDFGSMYDIGDPLRWSPVNIELLLVDRVPRKVVEKADVLSKLPNLLRAFVKFAYDERGWRRELLTEALEAIDRWEPEYQRLIRTPRVQGAEALARMMMGERTGLELDRWPLDPIAELAAAVGGDDELELLDDDPLPDEPFEWSRIEEDIRPKLEEILRLCDQNAEELLDVEHRTANRRLLHDVAVANPDFFRGRAAARTSAAAICYMVAHANHSLSAYGPLTASELLAQLGASSAGQRSAQFREFLGLPRDQEPGTPMSLGAADYLVGLRRAEIIVERDQYDELFS